MIFMGLALVHFQKYWLLSLKPTVFDRFNDPFFFKLLCFLQEKWTEILIIRLIGCLFYNLVFVVGKGGTSVPQALKLKCGRKKE